MYNVCNSTSYLLHSTPLTASTNTQTTVTSAEESYYKNLTFNIAGNSEKIYVKSITDYSPEAEKEIISQYLKYILFSALSSSAGKENFVLCGGAATGIQIKTILLQAMQDTSEHLILRDLIARAEKEFPFILNKCKDFDLSINQTKSFASAITNIMKSSLENHQVINRLGFHITPPVDIYGFCHKETDYKQFEESKIYRVLGHYQSIFIYYNSESLFKVDITYAPQDPPDEEYLYTKTFDHHYEIMSIHSSTDSYSVKLCTIKQLMDNLKNAYLNTYIANPYNNKFFKKIKLIDELIQGGYIKPEIEQQNYLEYCVHALKNYSPTNFCIKKTQTKHIQVSASTIDTEVDAPQYGELTTLENKEIQACVSTINKGVNTLLPSKLMKNKLSQTNIFNTERVEENKQTHRKLSKLKEKNTDTYFTTRKISDTKESPNPLTNKHSNEKLSTKIHSTSKEANPESLLTASDLSQSKFNDDKINRSITEISESQKDTINKLKEIDLLSVGRVTSTECQLINKVLNNLPIIAQKIEKEIVTAKKITLLKHCDKIETILTRMITLNATICNVSNNKPNVNNACSIYKTMLCIRGCISCCRLIGILTTETIATNSQYYKTSIEYYLKFIKKSFFAFKELIKVIDWFTTINTGRISSGKEEDSIRSGLLQFKSKFYDDVIKTTNAFSLNIHILRNIITRNNTEEEISTTHFEFISECYNYFYSRKLSNVDLSQLFILNIELIVLNKRHHKKILAPRLLPDTESLRKELLSLKQPEKHFRIINQLYLCLFEESHIPRAAALLTVHLNLICNQSINDCYLNQAIEAGFFLPENLERIKIIYDQLTYPDTCPSTRENREMSVTITEIQIKLNKAISHFHHIFSKEHDIQLDPLETVEDVKNVQDRLAYWKHIESSASWRWTCQIL